MRSTRFHLPIPALGLALWIALAGCRGPADTVRPAPRPASIRLSGTVTLPTGKPVWVAHVNVAGVDSVVTDTAGTYSLIVPVALDSVVVTAFDGFTPGLRYTDIHFNTVPVELGTEDQRVDIVLKYHSPI